MIKKIAKSIDGISSFLLSNVTNSRKTFYELDRISYKESAQLIHDQGAGAVLLDRKDQFWIHALNNIPAEGSLLEFGVFQGNSINFFSEVLQGKNDQRKIYGFDSFEGLSEDWSGTSMVKSTFDMKGNLPKVHANVVLIKGWIDKTLPPFIENNLKEANKIAFMHIDMDTYSPTKLIFEETVPHLQPGCIIVFDQLLGYPGWRDNEYKALMECIAPKWTFEFISFCEPRSKNRNTSKYIRAAIKIKGKK
ncbi:class I SAM-dependent methyltransferase [Marinoscillum sp.]|uniref:class I SAM-dependent methyltransferase n=1 Tax=Marinoscillum sp. TaxID=2024838 RepID=UPI003BA932C3